MLRPTLILLTFFTILTGAFYPALLTAIGNGFFASEASGSLVLMDGRVVGSRLIAQRFTEPKYFWPRPSAADYDAMASSGSNLGPTNPKLAKAINARTIAEGPADLITTSASGLDPHVSPEAAMVQVRRVARARGLPEERVRSLVEAHTEPRTFGLLGEPRVNVLLLNLALDDVR